MAWRLFGDNPLLEPRMVHCQLDYKEQISYSKIHIEIQKFSFKKMHIKMSSAEMADILSQPHCVKAYGNFNSE